ncbi:non-ribosomal peptide synthetase [Nocardia goodfellowii]|uniref:Amino acid adenylation domain-containing protein n=1 Tax=Nocardia goodfellowii TaxID=882446 RepID=A0ABS4Q727_9NOCA|nr:non-ribosomal peptide synthetase [Nocardia goodfellowii]MBP2187492.1 amino acid adenylation domain-containing protein [Nocardia goodfellowii]
MDITHRSGRSAHPGAARLTFDHLLTAAVAAAADAVAVRAGAEEFTYRQLDADSSRLARELIARGLGPGDMVALGVARGVESVLAVWAIAKTGAAYVPVDPADPTEWVAHIVRDCGATIGVTTSRHRRALGSDIYWIELDDPVVAQRILDRPEHPITEAERVRSLDERHPAYAIYTDEPKGVVVTHTGLAGLVAASAHYRVTADSRVLHGHSPNADVSVLELLLACSAGATLVVSPPSISGGPELTDLLRAEQVTHLLSTPRTLTSIDPADLPDLQVVVVTGDTLDPDLLTRWTAPTRDLYHCYGPTETTTLATSTPPIRTADPITLGTPIPGIDAFVLDPRLRPVPTDATGELYLSGPALAQGYFRDPAPTSDRFIANPFGAKTDTPGTRLYRTGKLVRRTTDGVLIPAQPPAAEASTSPLDKTAPDPLGKLDRAALLERALREPGLPERTLGETSSRERALGQSGSPERISDEPGLLEPALRERGLPERALRDTSSPERALDQSSSPERTLPEPPPQHATAPERSFSASSGGQSASRHVASSDSALTESAGFEPRLSESAGHEPSSQEIAAPEQVLPDSAPQHLAPPKSSLPKLSTPEPGLPETASSERPASEQTLRAPASRNPAAPESAPRETAAPEQQSPEPALRDSASRHRAPSEPSLPQSSSPNSALRGPALPERPASEQLPPGSTPQHAAPSEPSLPESAVPGPVPRPMGRPQRPLPRAVRREWASAEAASAERPSPGTTAPEWASRDSTPKRPLPEPTLPDSASRHAAPSEPSLTDSAVPESASPKTAPSDRSLSEPESPEPALPQRPRFGELPPQSSREIPPSDRPLPESRPSESALPESAAPQWSLPEAPPRHAAPTQPTSSESARHQKGLPERPEPHATLADPASRAAAPLAPPFAPADPESSRQQIPRPEEAQLERAPQHVAPSDRSLPESSESGWQEHLSERSLPESVPRRVERPERSLPEGAQPEWASRRVAPPDRLSPESVGPDSASRHVAPAEQSLPEPEVSESEWGEGQPFGPPLSESIGPESAAWDSASPERPSPEDALPGAVSRETATPERVSSETARQRMTLPEQAKRVDVLRESASRHVAPPEPLTSESALPERSRSEEAVPESPYWHAAQSDSLSSESASPEQAVRERALPEPASRHAAQSDSLSSESALPGRAGFEGVPPESASRQTASPDRALPDRAVPDSVSQHRAASQPLSSESALPGRTGADRAVPESASRHATPSEPLSSESALPGRTGSESAVPESPSQHLTSSDPLSSESAFPGRSESERAVPESASRHAAPPQPLSPEPVSRTDASPEEALSDGTLPESASPRTGMPEDDLAAAPGQTARPARRVLHSVQRPAVVPLSYAQERMWFRNRFEPSSAVDNVPVAVRLSGRLDVVALQSAMRDLVQRHEVLRTVYPEVDGGGVQVVLPLTDPRAVPPLPTLDSTPEQVAGFVTRVAMTKFDVTVKPPIRVQLLRLRDHEHVLVCVVHHIAGDSFSMDLLIRDLMSAYAERVRGGRPDRPMPGLQYADYTIWQRELLGSQDDPESLLSTQSAYWQRQLAALPEQLNLPADRPRPAVASNRGATFQTTVDAELHDALKTVASHTDSTLFMVAHTALAVLLSRLSGTRDIVIGTLVPGRNADGLDELIGMFVNTLVLRTEIDPGISFADLLAQVRRTDLEALEHVDLPFEWLVQALDPVRSTARHPLFQVLLVGQNMARTQLELPELSVAGTAPTVPLAKYDLQLELVEELAEDGSPQGLSLTFRYATDLFDEPTVADFADRFRRILSALTTDTTAVVGDVDLLAPGERALVLREWNTQGAAIPEVTLVDLVAAQARRRPDAIAVRCGDVALTFAELQRRANRAARALIAHGAGPETIVAVALPRTEELPVGLLAVLLTGAGYLPIDTTYPAQRLDFMLSDAAPAALLTTADVIGTWGWRPSQPVLLLERTGDRPDGPVTDRDRFAPLRPDNLAYVMYTSGSTGVPKGVGVPHRAVVELFANTQLLFDFDETDVWTLFHSVAFDFSVWELWCALANGGTVVVVDHHTARSPESFRELLIREQVTVLNQTPSAFYQLAEADRTAPSAADLPLRYVVFGGEALDLRQLKRWYERHPMDAPWLVNMYGLTEATVHVTFLALNAQMVDDAASVIGRALPGLHAYVIEERLHPAPVGVAGEINVAGKQLARGYLGSPGLTATRFVANPFGEPGSRMYRTGDVGRWVGLGGRANLEYAGRSDQQVQLHGFRIELGEIESALLRCPGVRQAVVLVSADEHAGDRIVGYAVPDKDTQLDPNELRTRAAEFLTAYMVPDAIVVLDALPLTPNGKLDRKALPAAEFAGATFRAPSSPIELAVAEVFATLLHRAEIGLDDDFFALGGNSQLATRAVARINAALDANLAVRELFQASTVAALAARVALGASTRPPLARGERPARIPLSLVQQPVWARNQLDPAAPVANLPLAIRLTGVLDVSALRYAVADVLERHEVLRTRYPAIGPDGVPYQEIVSVAEALPGGLDMETTTNPIAHITDMMSRGFDVTTAPPLRAVLLNSADNPEEHLLVIVAHGISVDRLSMAPLVRDLVTAYVSRVEGRSPAWVPLEVQYADFALWQRTAIGTEDDETSAAAKQVAYWRDRLAGSTGAPALPLDRPRPPVPSRRSASIRISLPAEVHRNLDELAHEHNSTLFMVVHAALAVLLARMSGNSDIAIGTAVAGRGERALEDLVGMFANTLALRITVDSEASFDDLVEQAREADLSAFGNADVPFERVVEEVAAGRSAPDPLFQVALSFDNAEAPTLTLPGLTISGLDTGALAAEFDLQVIVDPRASGELNVVLSYAIDLFDESTIKAFGRSFERILTVVAADPEIAVGAIDLLDEVTPDPEPVVQAAQVATAETTGTAGAALAQSLTAAVEDDPESPALVWGDQVLTYRQLDARSSQLARLLIAHGCGPGTGVALRLPRGVEAMVASWAVLKAGAALLPGDQPVGLNLMLGLTSSASPSRRTPEASDRVDWLTLDDPALGAELDAQSTRPVTYATRLRTLRGGDPALRTADHTLTYDQLAAAADRFALRAGLTYESRTFATSDPVSAGGLIELVAAGGQGAALVVAAPAADLTGLLAEEWVTHLVTDLRGLSGVDFGVAADLRAAVLTDGDATAPIPVLPLAELLGLEAPSRIG